MVDHHIPVEGVIGPAVSQTLRLNPRRLGLIGGRRTVLSGVYRKAFAAHGIKLKQRIAQPLSGLIESGDVASVKLRGEAARILGPLRTCSHILLACTHYPAITPMLKTLVSGSTEFIDPAAELIQTVARWDIAPGGKTQFLTTGDPRQMRCAAKKAFGVDIGRAMTANI